MKNLQPMLLETIDEPFDDAGWIFEYKWDGFRALTYINEDIKIISRNGNNLTPYFPELNVIQKCFKRGTILDGEIIAYNGQKGCFSQILKRTKNLNNKIPIRFVAFDILADNSKNLINQPLYIRKTLLRKLNEEFILTASYVELQGKKAFEVAKENNFEGIVAKKMSSLYYPGIRTSEWLKIKNFLTGDFVVIGMRLLGGCPHTMLITDSNKSFEQEIVLPGTNEKKYQWLQILDRFIIRKDNNLFQLEPILGAKVSYLEKTSDGKLRHAKIYDFFPLGG